MRSILQACLLTLVLMGSVCARAGEKTEVKGMITSRAGETLVVKGDAGTATVVLNTGIVFDRHRPAPSVVRFARPPLAPRCLRTEDVTFCRLSYF